MKAPTETGLVKMVKQFLELRGGFAIRVNSGAFAGTHAGKRRFVRLNSEPGCSDVLACYRGWFLEAARSQADRGASVVSECGRASGRLGRARVRPARRGTDLGRN